MSNATDMPITGITIDPRYRRRQLGNMRKLQQSIQKVGLLRPIAVTSDGMLLAGERRLLACRNLGWESMRVVVARDGEHAIDLIRADQETGPCSLPMTATELGRLGLRIEEHGKHRAAANRGLGHRKLADDQTIAVRDIASQVTGVPGHQYQKLRTLVIAAAGFASLPGGYELVPVDDKVRDSARQALDLADRVFSGEEIRVPRLRRALTISRIYIDWAEARRSETVPLMANGGGSNETYPATTENPANHRRPPQRGQREALANALASLTGLCAGLASIGELDPSTTSEEAASWQRDLSNAARTLRTLQHKIKEHINATA